MKLAKIVHLSTNDFGGAGSAALRYHEAFLALGYDSEMYVAESKSSVQDGRIKLIAGSSLYMKLKAAARKFFSPKLFSKLRQFLAEKERFSPKRKYLFFTTGESIEQGLNPRLVSAIEQADFLFVHWVAGFSSTHDVLEIHKKTGCKVYFVTMDMAHLTGAVITIGSVEGLPRTARIVLRWTTRVVIMQSNNFVQSPLISLR